MCQWGTFEFALVQGSLLVTPVAGGSTHQKNSKSLLSIFKNSKSLVGFQELKETIKSFQELKNPD